MLLVLFSFTALSYTFSYFRRDTLFPLKLEVSHCVCLVFRGSPSAPLCYHALCSFRKFFSNSTIFWPISPNSRIFPEFGPFRARWTFFAQIWHLFFKLLVSSSNLLEPPRTSSNLPRTSSNLLGPPFKILADFGGAWPI